MLTRLHSITVVVGLVQAVACHAPSARNTEGGIPDVALPPVVDATFPANDSALTQDQQLFSCGRLSGAVNANLVCMRVFHNLNWDVSPGSGLLFIRATTTFADAGSKSVPGGSLLAFEILTPLKMSPLQESCASLPPPLPGALKPSFTASFAPGTTLGWSAACANATTQITPGTSFELNITSVGTLTSDSAGADPLDASADAFDWSKITADVLSNSFHGTLKATLVDADGGMPLYVSMTF